MNDNLRIQIFSTYSILVSLYEVDTSRQLLANKATWFHIMVNLIDLGLIAWLVRSIDDIEFKQLRVAVWSVFLDARDHLLAAFAQYHATELPSHAHRLVVIIELAEVAALILPEWHVLTGCAHRSGSVCDGLMLTKAWFRYDFVLSLMIARCVWFVALSASGWKKVKLAIDCGGCKCALTLTDVVLMEHEESFVAVLGNLIWSDFKIIVSF